MYTYIIKMRTNRKENTKIKHKGRCDMIKYETMNLYIRLNHKTAFVTLPRRSIKNN